MLVVSLKFVLVLFPVLEPIFLLEVVPAFLLMVGLILLSQAVFYLLLEVVIVFIPKVDLYLRLC